MVLPPITSMTQDTKPPLFVVSQIKSRSQTGKLQGQQGKGNDLTNPCKSFTAMNKLSLEKWINETCFKEIGRVFTDTFWGFLETSSLA